MPTIQVPSPTTEASENSLEVAAQLSDVMAALLQDSEEESKLGPSAL